MTGFEKYKSIYEILNDPNGDKDLQQGVLEALKPIHKQIEQSAGINGNKQLTPIYRTCQELNHCPAVSAKDMSVQGYTTAPAFNIFGPSGRQSLSSYRVRSHTGKIILEGAKADGQFSIDIFKSGVQEVVSRSLKNILKDKVKDEALGALFDPKNYADVSVFYKTQNSQDTFKTSGPLLSLIHI